MKIKSKIPPKDLVCSWSDPRLCQSQGTHYHHAYGIVCGYHAKTIEQLHPGPSERCKRLKGALLTKLFPGLTQAGPTN